MLTSGATALRRRGPLVLAAAAVAVVALRLRPQPRAEEPARASGKQLLERLRSEPWARNAERLLAEHPYVSAAEAGTLTFAQRRAFVGEQYSVQRSDARSFANLAGHADFRPSSLAGAIVPPLAQSGAAASLFQFLAEGEVYAAPLLLRHAAALGMSGDLVHYAVTPGGQGYPAYWAHLAQFSEHAAGAAACAINFPAWGRMCGRVSAALASGLYSNVSSDELGFLDFFAEPIEGLDQMAIGVLDEKPASYKEVATAVRLLQGYELMFWDAVYAAQ
mmetsp:Transcript_79096/g.236981  ORF Transcript_79096/g.236981 Transcript_79096/m.236981 type:complete len:276 (-) Transcript_79096:59-886(-)